MGEVQFSSLREFLQMGQYAFHVWTVYLIFLVFLVVNVVQPLIQRKSFIKEQKRRARRDAQVE